MFSPFAAANIAISVNHMACLVFGAVFIIAAPWSWPSWLLFWLPVGIMTGIDFVLWPLVYFAAKNDGWDPVLRRYSGDCLE